MPNYEYEASPECAERQCRITRADDQVRLRSVYQHGDNPEAVFLVDRISYALNPAAETRQRFREWAERCHRYDDAEEVLFYGYVGGRADDEKDRAQAQQGRSQRIIDQAIDWVRDEPDQRAEQQASRPLPTDAVPSRAFGAGRRVR